MNTPFLNEGDHVILILDGQKYLVDTVTPSLGGTPMERLYFIRPANRWPWQSVKTHLIPERAAKKLLTLVR